VDHRQGGGDREKPAVNRLLASSLAAGLALAVAGAPLAAQAQGRAGRPAAPAVEPTPAATPTPTSEPATTARPANSAAKAAEPTPAASPTPTQPEAPPPYEAQLLRLAELTGALAYLRDLCGDDDGAAFRAKFADLVDTEGTTDARKESLAGAFNRGFRDYELTYRACTPTAREIVARFLDEASRIAKDVANRYSG
jgi:uncharacterized protein (TIGR02301 family)